VPEPAGVAPAQPPLTEKQPSTAPSAAAPTAPAPGETASGVSPDAQGPAQSLRRTGTDVVALTFDDGPDPVQTPKLLQLLASHQVTATFCLVGERAQAHPDLVRQIAAAGHTLCNHSWNHSFTLGAQPPEAIRKDLEATDKAIRDAVPDAPIPYFRAPGGIFTDRLVSVADEYQMKSLYWEVDPRDWDHTADADDAKHVERVVAEVRRDVRPGSIVLSHDFNQPQTIVAYEQLLPYLTEKYQLGLP
jgi:peptidoglycan/xylan/chitin deacetylase (PgdA/CDA1 family)